MEVETMPEYAAHTESRRTGGCPPDGAGCGANGIALADGHIRTNSVSGGGRVGYLADGHDDPLPRAGAEVSCR